MENIVFWAIIGIYTVMKLFEFFTEYLDHRARDRTIPDNVSDVYDQETYQRWKEYSSEQSRIGLLVKGIRFIILLGLLLSGALAALANVSQDWFSNVYFSTFAFLGVLFIANFILSTIVGYYHTFSIEARYGFNTSTKKTYVKDTIIKLFISIIFGGGILTLLLFIYEQFASLFIVIASVAVLIIFLLINIGYVKIILPLFNTLSPLEDGELKDAIESLAKQENYTIKNIHTMDASKRSTKLNAFFSGFGRFKNVVLFDTLLEKMNNAEILAVLAHEIGHAKHKDVLKNTIIGALNLVVMLSLLYAFFTFDVFHEAFDVTTFHFGFALIIFSILLNPISLLIGIFGSFLSRKAEYKADAYAASVTSSDSMVSALKVLAKENFANLTPHELYVILHYSHPPMSQRIQALKG